MIKAFKEMGLLKNAWDYRKVPLASKIKLHEDIPVSLLLWGGDNWSGNRSDVTSIEAFRENDMCGILKILMFQVKE